MRIPEDLLNSEETLIFINERGEPISALLSYVKYRGLMRRSATQNTAQKNTISPDSKDTERSLLTSGQFLDNINREIAQRKEEQQLPIMPGDDSVINDDDDNDEEDQLYLEDITSF